MKLTRSAGYALVAVGHISRVAEENPILAKVIAKQYKIPLDYLLKIMQQLVRADILNSIRGPRGGFTLAKAATRISVLDIIEAVDGPFITEPELSRSRTEATFNKKLTSLYQQAAKQAAKTLGQTSIASLAPPKKKKKAKR